MDLVPVALFWGLGIWGFFSRKPVLLYLFFGSMPFGAFAVVPTQLTAGLTFTATPIVSLLIIARVLGSAKGIGFFLESALDFRRLGLLTGFWVTAIFTTLFMPSLFAGQVDIIPVRGTVSQPSPLFPTTQNISQLFYVSISVLAVFAFSRLLQSHVMRQRALEAICVGAAMAILTGLLDFLSQYIPIQPLLAPFRTATYALLTDVEVLGAKRVVGLMPEASSFGSVCVAFLTALYFFRRAILNERLRDRAAPVAMAFLALFAYLSTSSAALVALAIVATMAALEWVWRSAALRRGALRRRGLAAEAWLAFGAAGVLVVVLMAVPSVFDPVINLLDRMLFQKTSSQSFEERNMWTATSWNALVATYGIGVGIGGTRASNALVAVFSNVGIVGGLLYYAFIAQSLLRRAPKGDEVGAAMISAVRWSFPPGFVIGLLIGTSANFGTFGAFRYGLVAAISYGIYQQLTVEKRSSTRSEVFEGG